MLKHVNYDWNLHLTGSMVNVIIDNNFDFKKHIVNTINIIRQELIHGR